MQPVASRDDALSLLAVCELHGMLGLQLDEWDEGRVLFSFAPPAFARDPRSNAVHGGVIATALDTVAGFAVTSTSGYDIYTIDLRTDFLRPAVDRVFTVEGRTLRAGNRFGWGDATLYAADGRKVAIGRGTFGW
jgi:uncharacterized protein (TIGR00369 family)